MFTNAERKPERQNSQADNVEAEQRSISFRQTKIETRGIEHGGSSPKPAMRLLRATPLVALLMLLCAMEIRGHGRLRVPPSRGSMWRDGFNNPIYYNDNELFCGGYYYQNSLKGGKCGICGDPWGTSAPLFEAGGTYANGIITRTYTEGQKIGIAVEVTTQHGGWFEFRICPNNDVTTPATHECLNSNLLPLADGTGSRIYLQRKGPIGFYNTTFFCRWDFLVRSNNWGTDKGGRSCVGCGPQEEFYGCADVAIRPLQVERGVAPSARDLAPPAGDLAPPAGDLAPPAGDLAPPVAPQNPDVAAPIAASPRWGVSRLTAKKATQIWRDGAPRTA
ncbi:hypothetical protein LSAT2_031562 [Lamellibrachia satsuma]|nr:hypothetical protein LSAT2_031562 [Lamellibrachia satsuma]